MIEDLNIDERNINLVLGILFWPKQVQKSGMSEDDSEEYIDILRELKARHGELSLDITVIPNVILKYIEARDEFKRDIVMYIVSSVLNYLLTRKCITRLIKNFINIKDIKN